MEVFIIQLKLAFVIALAVAFPYCIWQIWKFVLPALYKSERKALKWWMLSSSCLFLLGVLFCSIIILPMLMKFSMSFSSPELQPIIGLNSFLELAGWLMFAFGVMFQLPVAVMLGIRFGLVKRSFLSAKRPYVIIAILILSATLTPPDVLSQLLLAMPTYLLFELGLLFSRNLEKKDSTIKASNNSEETIQYEQELNEAKQTGDGMLDFYIREEYHPHKDTKQTKSASRQKATIRPAK